LPEISKPPHLARRGGVWFEREVGALSAHLGVERPFAPARKAHPAFLVADLSALRRRLEAAGYAVAEDEPLAGCARCHVADPFGNRIELL
jgi:catechol 2,3-dioxygenase-like lactoylglutathione lyase family enzyme